ncbi:MAG: sulfite exporter TauE/SafE family protein [Cyclobacteriaceae bacterium]|nr:sulfite exporter TauE/SafE family protein [Cyclobacteriaceae bacterium]
MLLAAFILGFTGSLHCVGMCGPIAMMVGGKAKQHVVVYRLLYNIGRTITYMAMGAVVGMFGKIIQWGSVQGKISIAVGVLILVVLIVPKVQALVLPSFSKIVLRLKQAFGRQLQSKKFSAALITGFFNGFLPCGLVYAALAIALVQADLTASVLAMALFGLGTIPAMLFAAYFWQRLRSVIPWSFQRIQTVMLVLVAVLMIWRGVAVEGSSHHVSSDTTICIPAN